MNSTQELSKRTKSSPFHRGRFILFIAGCALGAVCFLWVYGARILDPVYDAWLFETDMDLRQHYIGFCHYRMSGLSFPLGMTDTLSYPTGMSVIYTDSIPLAALFFRIFSGILPVHFQYFGIFGLVSFMLTGGLSSLLIHSLISTGDNGIEKCFDGTSDGRIPFVNRNLPYVLSLTVSVIYILSFTVLQRMYYHTALGAQWIIILALYIWIEGESFGRKKTVIIYSLMGLLCVGIHTYFVPMAGSILLAASVERVMKHARKVTDEAINIACFCVSGLLTLFVFGAFKGPTGGYGEGLGSFTSNLNTFINPIYGSIILKPMKLYYDFQYEGYGYLGIGVFLLFAAALVCLVKNVRRTGFGGYFKTHIRALLFLCLFVIDFMLAVLPMVTFSDRKLFGLPLPSFIRSAAGVFRSNGRFIWVPVYLLFTGASVYAIRLFSERFGKMEKGKGIVVKILLVAVLIQVLDTTRVAADKQAYFKTEHEHVNVLEDFVENDPSFAVDAGINGKPGERYDEFVFLYNENDIIMDVAFYAYLNGMKLNNFYFARDIDNEVDKYISEFRNEIKAGNAADNVIYICKADDEILGMEGVTWYELDEKHRIGVSRN